MPLHPGHERIETLFARGQADAVHHPPRDIRGERECCFGRLAIDGTEEDAEEGGDRGRLLHVHRRPEMQVPVAQLGEDVDGSLAFRHRERRSRELEKSLGDGFEPPRVRDERLHFLLAPHLLESVEDSLYRRRKRDFSVVHWLK